MHLFFPFAFVFLLCSVPFFLAAFIVYYKKFRFRKLPDGHRDLKCETKNTPKLKKPHISPQMSRRRNFRAKLEDPAPNEQKPMVESSSPMKHFLSPDESLDQDDHDFISRNETIIEESLNELKNEKNSENNYQEGYADEDEDVKARDNITNRIVGWNEDDSKNLMDLGLSEIERNQRLENLIARRRARKFLMAIRGQASVLYENEFETVRKMAPVKTENIPSSDEDPVPGSAPSVLLPTRNPFDIPYDPTEEKPNLMVDGFQQEFLGAHQISRHESFTLGTSFEIDKDRDSMRPAQRRYMDRVVNRESSRFARLRKHPVQEDHDRLIEKLRFQQQYPDEDESCSSANKDEQETELSGQQNDTENTSDEQLHARKSQEASSSSDVVEIQRQKPEHEITSSSDQLLHSSSSSSPIELQSSDGEVEMEKESINFESREELPLHPPQINNTIQVEEEVMKQQEPEVIEIGPSMGGEDKSSVSVGNIEDDEDEGGVLVTQSHSNEECRDRRERSCESLDQVVDIPEEEEEESIFFVDNSHSMPPLSPEQASEDSRPTLLDNPEEIDNQQPPVEDIISDTRKYNDEEYINPFTNSVEEVELIGTNNPICSTTNSNENGDEKFSREGDDIKEESTPEQLNSESLDVLENRGVESEAPPIEQLISEPIDQVSQSGVSHAPTDEQVNTTSGIV